MTKLRKPRANVYSFWHLIDPLEGTYRCILHRKGPGGRWLPCKVRDMKTEVTGAHRRTRSHEFEWNKALEPTPVKRF